jgi:hypothetical protein
MSLRKSPELTPELVEAARRNAQHATGPRSAAGKEKMKMNALKHGFYAAAENYQLAMLALGEDPQEFDDLQQELLTTYGPGDALWRKQIEDLAKLYWRRGRLERMQTGVMRRALQEVEEGQHRREQEMANATFDPSHAEMLEITMAESTDPGVRLRRILSSLGVIRAQVAQDPLSGPAARPISPPAQTSASEVCGSSSDPETNRGPQNRGSELPENDGRTGGTQSTIDNQQSTIENRQSPIGNHQSPMESLYRGMMGWRVARICRLLRLFSDSDEAGEQQKGATPQAGEPELQELLRLLDEEIAAVQQEFEYAEKVNAEKASIERDACLAPVGETWRMMLRQESALDRSIDRKVKIILGLRKQFFDDSLQTLTVRTNLHKRKDREMEDIDPTLGTDIPYEDPATLAPPELKKSRNKPGMSMKTKGNSPKAGSDKMYQPSTNLDGDGGNASRNAAA